MLSFDIHNYDIYSEKDLSVNAAAVLKKREGRTIKAGGLWVYDNEIAQFRGDFEDGDIISVEDFDGYFMGYGFVNRKSRITVRLLSRRKDKPVTPAFLTQRVKNAWEYRKKVIDTSSCRLLFGEADFMPGLTVDKYEDVLVVESLALGIDRLKGYVLAALVKVLEEDGVKVRGIYERSDAKVRELEGMAREKGFLTEPFDTKILITENGVRYIVDVENGQKTGFFLDQKDNRRAIHRLCGGAKVLDCFTHTGSFALNAAVAGASSVIAVDASDLAVAQAEENARLNGVEDRVQFLCRDVFAWSPAPALTSWIRSCSERRSARQPGTHTEDSVRWSSAPRRRITRSCGRRMNPTISNSISSRLWRSEREPSPAGAVHDLLHVHSTSTQIHPGAGSRKRSALRVFSIICIPQEAFRAGGSPVPLLSAFLLS